MISELLSSHCRWTDKGDNNTKYPSRSPAALRLLQARAQLRTAAHYQPPPIATSKWRQKQV